MTYAKTETYPLNSVSRQVLQRGEPQRCYCDGGGNLRTPLMLRNALASL